MGTIREERQRLRSEIARRRKETIPALRAAVKAARRARADRVRTCRAECKRKAREAKAKAKKARVLLAAALKRARKIVKSECHSCDSESREGIERIQNALTRLGEEGQAVAALKSQLRGLRSSRGRAGGRRAADLKNESDDEVRRDLGDDRALVEIWERVKRKIRGTARMTRTEAFFHWLHDHSAEVDKIRSVLQREAEEDAEQLYAGRANLTTEGRLDETEETITRLHAALARCERRQEVPL